MHHGSCAEKFNVVGLHFRNQSSALFQLYLMLSDLTVNKPRCPVFHRLIDSTLVARCFRQLIGLAAWFFVTLGPLRYDGLETVAYGSYCNMVEWFWWD